MICLTQYDGTQLHLKSVPEKIVSLVPSVTETLVEWGKLPVARTQFCIYPKTQVASIPMVKGTKNPNLEQVMALKPDLVIANKEENRKEDIAVLAENLPVWINYPDDILSTVAYLEELAKLCPNQVQSKQDIVSIKSFFAELKSNNNFKVACFIWKKPWMVAASETYISSLIECCAENVFAQQQRYPKIELDDVLKLNVSHVFLLTEPFCFNDTHKQEFESFFNHHDQQVTVEVMNGEDFTWPGKRAINAVHAMQKIFI